MRWIILTMAIAMGCGPSAKEVETAKAARYRGPAARIFEIAETVTKETFKIGDSDPYAGAFITLPKWYSPDGQSESAGVGDAVQVEDGSLLVALLVQVAEEKNELEDPGRQSLVTVTVTPVVERFRMGQSTADKVPPDDPSMPGWVGGKADALLTAIHARAKEHVVAP